MAAGDFEDSDEECFETSSKPKAPKRKPIKQVTTPDIMKEDSGGEETPPLVQTVGKSSEQIASCEPTESNAPTESNEPGARDESSSEEDLESKQWIAAEAEIRKWAVEAVAIHFKELGCVSDRPELEIEEKFCEKPDCPPHEVRIFIDNEDGEYIEEIAIPGGVIDVTRQTVFDAVARMASGESIAPLSQKEIDWSEDKINESALGDLFGM